MCIDLKSFYASVECVERKLDPLTTNLVVADPTRTEKTICLAVSPSLKKYGISGRTVRAINSGASWRKDYLNYPIRESLIEIQRKQKKEQEQKNKLLNANQAAKLHAAQVEKIRIHGIQLAKHIIVYGFSAVGRLYQVSHTTVRRWCKKDNIPDTVKELTIWYYNTVCKHDQFSCQNA